jgi:hypothetical protein
MTGDSTKPVFPALPEVILQAMPAPEQIGFTENEGWDILPDENRGETDHSVSGKNRI